MKKHPPRIKRTSNNQPGRARLSSTTELREFQELLEAMYDTSEWEAIRQQRGWSNLYISRDNFVVFLREQEKEMALLMDELGIR